MEQIRSKTFHTFSFILNSLSLFSVFIVFCHYFDISFYCAFFEIWAILRDFGDASTSTTTEMWNRRLFWSLLLWDLLLSLRYHRSPSSSDAIRYRTTALTSLMSFSTWNIFSDCMLFDLLLFILILASWASFGALFLSRELCTWWCICSYCLRFIGM